MDRLTSSLAMSVMERCEKLQNEEEGYSNNGCFASMIKDSAVFSWAKSKIPLVMSRSPGENYILKSNCKELIKAYGESDESIKDQEDYLLALFKGDCNDAVMDAFDTNHSNHYLVASCGLIATNGKFMEKVIVWKMLNWEILRAVLTYGSEELVLSTLQVSDFSWNELMEDVALKIVVSRSLTSAYEFLLPRWKNYPSQCLRITMFYAKNQKCREMLVKKVLTFCDLADMKPCDVVCDLISHDENGKCCKLVYGALVLDAMNARCGTLSKKSCKYSNLGLLCPTSPEEDSSGARNSQLETADRVEFEELMSRAEKEDCPVHRDGIDRSALFAVLYDMAKGRTESLKYYKWIMENAGPSAKKDLMETVVLSSWGNWKLFSKLLKNYPESVKTCTKHFVPLLVNRSNTEMGDYMLKKYLSGITFPLDSEFSCWQFTASGLQKLLDCGYNTSNPKFRESLLKSSCLDYESLAEHRKVLKNNGFSFQTAVMTAVRYGGSKLTKELVLAMGCSLPDISVSEKGWIMGAAMESDNVWAVCRMLKDSVNYMATKSFLDIVRKDLVYRANGEYPRYPLAMNCMRLAMKITTCGSIEKVVLPCKAMDSGSDPPEYKGKNDLLLLLPGAFVSWKEEMCSKYSKNMIVSWLHPR